MSHTDDSFIWLSAKETMPFSPLYACLRRGSVKAYTDLENERIHCTAGHLWVTIEGDKEDHILEPGGHLEIPNRGKVIVSGPGCYRISKSIDGLDLAVAS